MGVWPLVSLDLCECSSLGKWCVLNLFLSYLLCILRDCCVQHIVVGKRKKYTFAWDRYAVCDVFPFI